ncbi:MAG: hypothetical protein FJW94_06050 [Actinobacteria bacterium]|nr:hypothetical protein [Actinomycetota bacterium]
MNPESELIDPTPSTPEPARRRSPGGYDLPGGLDVVLAGLVGGAGVIHLALVPAHAGPGVWLDPLAFALVGWVQIALAVGLLFGGGSNVWRVGTAVVNLAVVSVWFTSVNFGLPVGVHAGEIEAVDGVGAVAAGLEIGAVVVAVLAVVLARTFRPALLLPSMAAVTALALATTAIIVPGEHNGTHDHAAAVHDDGAAHQAEMAAIDATRCDLGFNPASYWSDAVRMGVDTYAGGRMAAHAPVTAMGLVGAVDPDQGRGSPGLDSLVSATSLAEGGEGAAARLIVALAESSEEDYEAWVDWTARSTLSSVGHGAHGSHGSSPVDAAAPDDNGGHGGHAGPQPWTAMIDQSECVRLAEELELARDTALAYPTAADALAGGWVRVTTYVPGIASHYMKFSLVDGRFDITQPEMLLYDGNGPEARMVGLSYYLLHAGDAEPTQGFTGANDHYHRHIGLCNGPGGVIGDSTTSAEECAARGGRKDSNSIGWMAHAWVVPGCESPWGVFSAASPLLDRKLAEASGKNAGACSASSVRDRYDLSPGGRPATGVGESAGGG